jgi:hypothetical protein
MNPAGEPIYPDAKRPTVFQDGMEFQDFVCTVLARNNVILQNLASKKYQLNVGENLQGFEIKLDRRCTETGRLSIEVAEKSRADMPSWIPSGIYRKDNAWLYIQGNEKILFVFAKNLLVAWDQKNKPARDETPTVRKFYLSLVQARHMAATVFDL